MDNCEVNLLATTDAKVWAEEWYRIFVRPESLSDGDYVGWMIGWFANAFEAQEFVDAQRIKELETEVARLRCLCSTEFDEMTDEHYQAWLDEAGKKKLSEAEGVAAANINRAEAAEALLREVSTAMHPTNPHQWLVLDKVLRAVQKQKEEGK